MSEDFSKVSTDELLKIVGLRAGVQQVPTLPVKSVVGTPAYNQELSRIQELDAANHRRQVARGVLDTPKQFMRGVVDTAHGIADLPLGAGQVASRIGGFFGATDAANSYSDFMREREAGIDKARGLGAGPNVARYTGSMVPALALAGAPAATFPGRMAQGAKLGGVLGLVTPVDEDAPGPSGTGFAGTKAVQVGGSAFAGGAAPALIEPLIKGIGSAINTIAGIGRGMYGKATGATNPQTIETTLNVELQRNGLDWSKLPGEVRTLVVSEVQNALKDGGTLQPEAAKRLADFASLNIKPMQGQLSRDPVQFAMEQNLGKMEIGRPIAERLTQQNQQLIGAVDSLRGNAPDAYGIGQNTISALRAKDAPVRAGVSDAYTIARNQAGMEADVPIAPIAQRIGQLIEDFGADRIPSAVMNRLKEYGVQGGNQTRVFNIREAEKLKTLIGNNIDNPQTPTGKALTLLRQSVDESVNSLGGTGGETAAAFNVARGKASARFGNIDRTPALANALDKQSTIAPEKFVETYAIRGNVQDVANFMRNLPVESRAELRSGVVDWIKQRAISGTEDAAKFSQSGFNNALRTIGDRKLELIFAGDKEGLATLRAIGRVGGYVQNAPVSSGVNYSGSGTTILDSLERASRLPLLSTVMGRPSDLVRAAAVSRSLNGSQAVAPRSPVVSEDLLARLAGPAGFASSPFAIGGFLGLQGPINR